jgi:hypothetical protein
VVNAAAACWLVPSWGTVGAGAAMAVGYGSGLFLCGVPAVRRWAGALREGSS